MTGVSTWVVVLGGWAIALAIVLGTLAAISRRRNPWRAHLERRSGTPERRAGLPDRRRGLPDPREMKAERRHGAPDRRNGPVERRRAYA